MRASACHWCDGDTVIVFTSPLVLITSSMEKWESLGGTENGMEWKREREDRISDRSLLKVCSIIWREGWVDVMEDRGALGVMTQDSS